MSKDPKDTIYIDVDDDITAIIDKLQASSKKIIALVLPKRATVFHSIVNMKLLKRQADQLKKNVVLITTESAIMPLAGAVEVHVAKTPQSKPEIPEAPLVAKAAANAPEDDTQIDKSASLGTLAGLADDEPIEVDNTDNDMTDESKAKVAEGKKPAKSPKKNKKFKIPNFEKFRSKLFIGIGLFIFLVIGAVYAFIVLPKAVIVLKTDTDRVPINMSVIADPSAQRLDTERHIIPAVNKEFRKTDSEKVAATGEKNLGSKATGTVSMTNCSKEVGSVTVAAGTGISASNLTFITNRTVVLPESSFNASGSCKTSSVEVGVTANNAGEKFNIGSDKTFSVAGYSAVSATNDKDFSGGSDKIVKIVTQEDIDKAKEIIEKRAGSEAPGELSETIEKSGYKPIPESLVTGEPVLTSSPNVDSEASEVTVTSTTVFHMLGVKEEDLKKLLESYVKTKIDSNKQAILDNGISKIKFQINQANPSAANEIGMQTEATAGPEINIDALKKEVTGKKRGDIENMLKKRPGINDVEVTFSPFWVKSVPNKSNKITITIEGKNSTSKSDNDRN